MTSNFQGQLLAAHPTVTRSNLKHSVMLIFRHDEQGVLGLQINRPVDQDFTLTSVMHGMGIMSNEGGDDYLYRGGNEGGNRVYVVHSLDWSSHTTVHVASDLGISSDVSVLSAISRNQGPELFRAIAGFNRWDRGELESELAGVAGVDQQWTIAPASIDLVFDRNGFDQWHAVIESSTKHLVSSWF